LIFTFCYHFICRRTLFLIWKLFW